MTSLGIVLVAVAAVAAAAALVVIPQAATIVTANEGTAVDLELSPLAERSSVYAADGSFLSNLSANRVDDNLENREEVSLDEIPQPVIDAVLAIEDSDFYEHDGVNLRATVRALVENARAGGIEQGGSTITQQLVKNSILTTDQNFDRKSTEAFYALRLERQMTKDEILERYLNTVYFGAGAHGVKAAAETYWGYTSPSELGWAEAAMLAGVIRNPTRYDPTLNPDEARERRNIILDRLVATGHLTGEEGDTIKMSPLPAERQQPVPNAPTDYFVQEVQDKLLNDESILGGDERDRLNAVYGGGLKIYTTFDPNAQTAALAAREELLPNIKEDCYTRQRVDNDPNGACIPEFTVATVTLDSHTGAVRALVGGPEFQREQFNLATQGARQPGSSMKTYVLAAAFEQGYTPSDSIRLDGPCRFPNPDGYPDPYVVSGRHRGTGTLTKATQQSNNCAFVRLGQIVGNDKVIELATRLGVTTDAMSNQLSLPLGSYEITPLEMAAAYAVFPNDGVYNEPYYIERIEDRDGNVIYEHRAQGARAVTTQTARMVAEVLEANVQAGTGRRAQIEGHFAAGKTGTTQEHADAWFVGFTDYYTTAVWLGDPNERIRIEFPQLAGVYSARGGFGGEIPASIWGHYMGALHADREGVPFAEPEPYDGNRSLKVPGEIEFCGEIGSGPTMIIDSDDDGIPDCIASATTEPPQDGGDDGGGDDGGDGGGGDGGGGDDGFGPGIIVPPGWDD
jgi:penicillin-binding protein 1A